MVWTAVRLAPDRPAEVPARIRASAIALLVLVLSQMYLGALVAGLDAGLTYNTWPLIDDRFVPPAADLLFGEPLWRNFFENRLTVQFDHRMMAYGLLLAVVLHVVDVGRTRRDEVLARAVALVAAVTVQAGLGIVTLLYHAPLALALAHQAMAMALLTIATVHAARLSAVRSPALAPSAALRRSS
jgi:cytochrome c oxidase assembly protein subunit 15